MLKFKSLFKSDFRDSDSARFVNESFFCVRYFGGFLVDSDHKICSESDLNLTDPQAHSIW